MSSRIRVVIPTKNRRDDLLRCLNSLAHQNWNGFEVLVIDNGSTDGTIDALKEFKANLLTEKTENLARLFNLGWSSSDADIIAYLNDDTEVVEDWAETFSKYLASDPSIKAIGGPTLATRPQRMYQVFEHSQNSAPLGLAYRIYDRVIMRGKFLQIGEFDEWGDSSIGGSLSYSTKIPEPLIVNGLTVTNMAIRREVLEQLGGFDESFMYVHADGDLFLRMRESGHSMVFHPRMIALHHLNPKGNTRSYYFLARDSCILWLKHSRTLQAGILSLLHAVFITAYVTLLTPKSLRIAHMRGWFRGLRDGVSYYVTHSSKQV